MTNLAQSAPPGNRRRAKSDLDGEIVAEWPINRRETARVSIEPYNGVMLVNFRKRYEAGGERRPSRQGIALNIKHLPRFVEAALKALTVAQARGLIAADDDGRQ